MSSPLLSGTAAVLDAARGQLHRIAVWPEPASGFAYRLLRAAGLSLPPVFDEPMRPVNPQLLRRAPHLAAFGYVLSSMSPEVQTDWARAFDRLMGRDVFPVDRNSFIHSPLELVGISLGVAESTATRDDQRAWLRSAIQQGQHERQFADASARAAADSAERLLTTNKNVSATPMAFHDSAALDTSELILLASLSVLFPDTAPVEMVSAEGEVLRRVLSEPIHLHDSAEAAGLCVLLERMVERALLGRSSPGDAVNLVTILCRRFPLFIERLHARQRSRAPFEVADEYDVQDVLHAILKLHFDDVRPEEWTPSYAGNSSRVDFLLPRERIVVEAKMTRANLGQKEVTNELIVDVARYAKMPHVESLICLVYDPKRRCANPAALENDLGQGDGRLQVRAIVCPRGT